MTVSGTEGGSVSWVYGIPPGKECQLMTAEGSRRQSRDVHIGCNCDELRLR